MHVYFQTWNNFFLYGISLSTHATENKNKSMPLYETYARKNPMLTEIMFCVMILNVVKWIIKLATL
jgi:hypothetical protein